ncbi:hypothetical protein Vafri_1996 [Volvox africanus]|nr:hypothetical protein Vafri_1996 [Volvox africanus]
MYHPQLLRPAAPWVRSRLGEAGKLATFLAFYAIYAWKAYHNQLCELGNSGSSPYSISLLLRLWHLVRDFTLAVFFHPKDPADRHDTLSCLTFFLGGIFAVILGPKTADARRSCNWRLAWLLCCVFLPKGFLIGYGLTHPSASMGSAVNTMLPRHTAIMLWLSLAFPLVWRRQALLAAVYVCHMLAVIHLAATRTARPWPYSEAIFTPELISVRLVALSSLSVMVAAMWDWQRSKQATQSLAVEEEKKGTVTSEVTSFSTRGVRTEVQRWLGSVRQRRAITATADGSVETGGGASLITGGRCDVGSSPPKHAAVPHAGLQYPGPAGGAATAAASRASLWCLQQKKDVGSGDVVTSPNSIPDPSALSSWLAAQYQMAPPARYRSTMKPVRLYVKLEGVAPEQLNPDAVPIYSEDMAARGFLLGGFAVRSGCIELVLDLQDINFGGHSGSGDVRGGDLHLDLIRRIMPVLAAVTRGDADSALVQPPQARRGEAPYVLTLAGRNAAANVNEGNDSGRINVNEGFAAAAAAAKRPGEFQPRKDQVGEGNYSNRDDDGEGDDESEGDDEGEGCGRGVVIAGPASPPGQVPSSPAATTATTGTSNHFNAPAAARPSGIGSTGPPDPPSHHEGCRIETATAAAADAIVGAISAQQLLLAAVLPPCMTLIPAAAPPGAVAAELPLTPPAAADGGGPRSDVAVAAAATDSATEVAAAATDSATEVAAAATDSATEVAAGDYLGTWELDFTVVLRAASSWPEGQCGAAGVSSPHIPEILAWQQGCFLQVTLVEELRTQYDAESPPCSPYHSYRVRVDGREISAGLISFAIRTGHCGASAIEAAECSGDDAVAHSPLAFAGCALLLPPSLTDVVEELQEPLAEAALTALLQGDADGLHSVANFLTDQAMWLSSNDITGLSTHIAQPSYGVLQPPRPQLQQPAIGMQAAAAAAAAVEPGLPVGCSTTVSSDTCTTSAWPSSNDDGYEDILRSSLGSEDEGDVLNKTCRSLALNGDYLCGGNPGDPGRNPEVSDAPPCPLSRDTLPPALDVMPRTCEGHNRSSFGGPASLNYGSEFEVMGSGGGGGGDRNVNAGCTDGAGKEGGDGRGEGRIQRGAGVKEGARTPIMAEVTAPADAAGPGVGPGGCSPRMLHGGRLDLRVVVADAVRLAHRTAKLTSAGQRAHAERHWSLLQHAVQCGWPALVRLLLGLHERCADGDVGDVSLLNG